MARVKKNRDVKKRDIQDHVVAHAEIKEEGVGTWDATQGEVHSDIPLELDEGMGNAVVVRSFDFKANPETFKHYVPSKQELFNFHALQIEGFLDTDGLKVMPEVNPQVKISKDKNYYRIVVGAEPKKGDILYQTPQTLKQIANDSRPNSG